MSKININGVIRDKTAEEQAEYDANKVVFDEVAEKLKTIRNMRLQKLIQTDYMANSDVTMPSYIKTWRQTLRDLPANHTNENAYDLLLARDSDNKLTHSVWTQPTS